MTIADTEQRRAVLPPTLAPRGLRRVEAAAYIGVSPSLFDWMIGQGIMPQPKRIGRRVIWDRLQLDEAFAAIPSSDEKKVASVWDEFVSQ